MGREDGGLGKAGLGSMTGYQDIPLPEVRDRWSLGSAFHEAFVGSQTRCCGLQMMAEKRILCMVWMFWCATSETILV